MLVLCGAVLTPQDLFFTLDLTKSSARMASFMMNIVSDVSDA